VPRPEHWCGQRRLGTGKKARGASTRNAGPARGVVYERGIEGAPALGARPRRRAFHLTSTLRDTSALATNASGTRIGRVYQNATLLLLLPSSGRSEMAASGDSKQIFAAVACHD
jgi:hypothetical protein